MRARAAAIALSICLAAVAAGAAEPGNLFFLHNSTGRYLIDQGDVRGLLEALDPDGDLGVAFWDQDYNDIGLRGPDGAFVAESYIIPDNDTDPGGLHKLWTTGNDARAAILQNHTVIAFKSCYTASAITSDEMLAQYKAWYLEMREVFAEHPDKVFVVLSPPPRHRLATTLDQADRARAFANWLTGPEYLAGADNVVGFDFFDALAHPDDDGDRRNMLRAEFERSASDGDSHPNTAANVAVAPSFCQALVDAIPSQDPPPPPPPTWGSVKQLFR